MAVDIPPITLEKFGGMVPVLDDRELPPTFAAFCENTHLHAEVLEGFYVPRELHTLRNPNARYVYRIPDSYAATDITDPATWMEFEDPFTTVFRAQVVEDQFDRYYWCVPGQPMRYNTATRIRAGNPSYLLGIPAPATAPGVGSSGGSSTVFVSRAYVYTWVSQFGEEGPPSPPTLHNGRTDATWRLVLTPPTPADIADRALDKVRVYRTITGSSGVATYFEIGEYPLDTINVDDAATDNVISANAQLESTLWTPPPVMEGVVQMPNGIVLGWNGTDIWFCEPYRPHAWPVTYGISTSYPIVGAGVFNQSAVICTNGYPGVVTGVTPAAMSMQRIEVNEPCLSRGSIVVTTKGVTYASRTGLILASPSGVNNITQSIFGPHAWVNLVNPYGLAGVRYAGVYLAFDITQNQGQFGGLFDPSDQRTAFTRIANSVPVGNILSDVWTGQAVLIAGGKVFEFDPHDGVEQIPYVWRSKRFRSPKRTNLGVAKLYFDTPPTPYAGGKPGEFSVDLGANELVRLKVIADGNIVYNQALSNPGEAFNLPAGFKAQWWQFEINARVTVVAAHFARDVKDLANV